MIKGIDVVYIHTPNKKLADWYESTLGLKKGYGDSGWQSFETQSGSRFGLDFISYGDHYDGNIGFLFDDEESGHYTFTFYIAKSFDNNKKRYSKRENIVEKADLKYIEDNYTDLLNTAISVYGSMKDDDMTDITILR